MMTLMRLNCEPIIRIFQVSSKQIRANYATKPKKTLSKLFGSAALILRPRQPHTRNTGLYYSYNTSIFASGTSHSSINVRVPTEFNSFNYELCLIRRIDRDRNVAFPGGIVKDTDATLEWNSRIFHLSPAQLSALWTLNSRCRQYREYISSLASAPPAAPTPLEALEKSMLPPALSFRICFARELFEETGMLLLPDIVLTARAHASGVLSTSSLDSERAHVLREPAYFLELLARHTKDLRAGHSQSSSNDALESCGFGAHEWSEWTSPFMVKPQLNALFYAFLLPPELVPLTEQRMKPDNTEIDQIHVRYLCILVYKTLVMVKYEYMLILKILHNRLSMLFDRCAVGHSSRVPGDADPHAGDERGNSDEAAAEAAVECARLPVVQHEAAEERRRRASGTRYAAALPLHSAAAALRAHAALWARAGRRACRLSLHCERLEDAGERARIHRGAAPAATAGERHVIHPVRRRPDLRAQR